jgi:hypothetical protein
MVAALGMAKTTSAKQTTKGSANGDDDALGMPGHLVPAGRIADAIVLLRGHKIMLDADLAELYGVETRALNQAVQRNRARFPADFMFRLKAEEAARLRSQFVISNARGGRRTTPHAFTEQGVAMLATVLRSPRAIQVNIEIMRAFVQLRQMLASNAALAKKLDALENRYDAHFKVVFQAIRELMAPPPPRKKTRIGFRAGKSA